MKYTGLEVYLLFIVCLLLFTVVLSSCVSYDTRFNNDTGKMYQCRTSGYGIVGIIVAKQQQETCKESALKQGFH